MATTRLAQMLSMKIEEQNTYETFESRARSKPKILNRISGSTKRQTLVRAGIILLALIAISTCVMLLVLLRRESGGQKAAPFWKDCSPSATLIQSVEVPECDTSLTKDRCALPVNGNFNVRVNFLQGAAPFLVPYYQIKIGPDMETSFGGCFYNLKCPGGSGMEQTFVHVARLRSDLPVESNITMEVRVREDKSNDKEAPDHLCVEIPIFIKKNRRAREVAPPTRST